MRYPPWQYCNTWAMWYPLRCPGDRVRVAVPGVRVERYFHLRLSAEVEHVAHRRDEALCEDDESTDDHCVFIDGAE